MKGNCYIMILRYTNSLSLMYMSRDSSSNSAYRFAGMGLRGQEGWTWTGGQQVAVEAVNQL